MSKTVKTRIEQLEQSAGQSEAIGVRWDGGLVEVNNTDEQLTLDEFWSKYPGGTVINVVYRDTPPDKKIEVDWSEVDE